MKSINCTYFITDCINLYILCIYKRLYLSMYMSLVMPHVAGLTFSFEMV